MVGKFVWNCLYAQLFYSSSPREAHEDDLSDSFFEEAGKTKTSTGWTMFDPNDYMKAEEERLLMGLWLMKLHEL